MKQDLWIANTSLLCIFAAAMSVYQLLQQEAPPWRAPKALLAPPEKKKEKPPSATAWEKIYQDDVFGTYITPEVKAVKQNLITPIPEPKAPVIPPPPEIKKQEFIAPLAINLRGIIAGGEEARNVAMVADETGKEAMYHMGEKIKDAQIVKIAHNRVVLLRANGQQEVFYLRKDEAPVDVAPADKWKYIVKKLDDQTFEIDPQEFAKEVESLGHFIERASIIGTAYSGGKSIGIRIGKSEATDLATVLGFAENDILTTVNDFDVADSTNRIKAYDALIQLPVGGSFKVGIKRADKDVFLVYKLVKIERPKKSLFGAPAVKEPSQLQDAFKMNRLQERERAVRTFDQAHQGQSQRDQELVEIRKRILENLQRRIHGAR